MHFHEFPFNMSTSTVKTEDFAYDTFDACGNPVLHASVVNIPNASKCDVY